MTTFGRYQKATTHVHATNGMCCPSCKKYIAFIVPSTKKKKKKKTRLNPKFIPVLISGDREQVFKDKRYYWAQHVAECLQKQTPESIVRCPYCFRKYTHIYGLISHLHAKCESVPSCMSTCSDIIYKVGHVLYVWKQDKHNSDKENNEVHYEYRMVRVSQPVSYLKQEPVEYAAFPIPMTRSKSTTDDTTTGTYCETIQQIVETKSLRLASVYSFCAIFKHGDKTKTLQRLNQVIQYSKRRTECIKKHTLQARKKQERKKLLHV